MPSAFTLGNLFFGFWAIVSAYNGNFMWAGWFIIFAGMLDMLDGRIARLAKTGSRFGAELDSLVDLVSFGVAPALHHVLPGVQTAGKFAWVLCYIYVVAVAVRLARYNVLRTGSPRLVHRHALAGGGNDARVLLPVQPDAWYQRVARVSRPAAPGTRDPDAAARLLMVSNVKYPQVPRHRLPDARPW